MERTLLSTDQIEQRLLDRQAEISRLTYDQMLDLEELDYRQVAAGDGSRNLSEWTASRLDLSLDRARSLVRMMRRTQDRPDLRQALQSGASLDRVEILSRIPDKMGLLEHLDVAGVQREAANRTRITGEQEQRTSRDQFLVLQPSLDESWWKGWFGLDGLTGAIVDQAIGKAADQLPIEAPAPTGWRKAMGLAQICVSDDPLPVQVTVFVDARHTAPSNGEAGIELEAGPRVGREALEAVLCDGILEVTARNEEGIPMAYGRKTRTVPSALRRFVLHRDGNTCAADGCPSRHRLQVHHILSWSQGGKTEAENLIALCWYHHQIVVHQQGHSVYHDPDHGRIRFRRTSRAPPAGQPSDSRLRARVQTP